MMVKYMTWMFSKPRDVGHVSDLLMCIRQRVFKELDPQPLTSRELNYFSSGKSVHETLQGLMNAEKGRFLKEHLVTYEGITGSIDLWDSKWNIPIEFKSPRDLEMTESKKYNEDQLRTYMAMLGADYGC